MRVAKYYASFNGGSKILVGEYEEDPDYVDEFDSYLDSGEVYAGIQEAVEPLLDLSYEVEEV